jgi:quercetin dioxygenase-like cupin family protein
MTTGPGGHEYLKEHVLRDELLAFDLPREVQGLRASPDAADRQGVALVKGGGLNIVLTVLRKDATLSEHTTSGASSVLVLDGSVRLRAGDRVEELGAGSLAAIDGGVAHDLVALEDAALLVTVPATA